MNHKKRLRVIGRMSKRQLKLFCTFAEDGFFDRGRAYLECSSWRKSEPKRWKVKELLAIEKIINKISIGGENETT